MWLQAGEITTLSEGDHVVLTFAYCGDAQPATAGHPAYCERMDELNFGASGTEITERRHAADRSTAASSASRSFATYAMVNERSAVRVEKDLPLEPTRPARLFDPDRSRLDPERAQARRGLNARGLGRRRRRPQRDHRRHLDRHRARSSRSTSTRSGSSSPRSSVPPTRSRSRPARARSENSRASTRDGVTHAFDTTGRADTLHDAVAGSGHRRASAAFVGGAKAGDEVKLEINQLLAGRSLQGVVQGDSDPQQLIPMLVDKIRHGRLPLEKLITEYPLDQINQAAADAAAGRAIKPVLVMPDRLNPASIATCMQFGIFDHIDDSGLPRGEQLEQRMQLIEQYDRDGFYAYHVAEHHGTPLGIVGSPNLFLVGGRAAHRPHPLRRTRQRPAALPPDPAGRGVVSARSHERRPPRTRDRPRRLGDRGELLRDRR